MMPITMMKDGETGVIKKVGGKEETRKFLENLGLLSVVQSLLCPISEGI